VVKLIDVGIDSISGNMNPSTTQAQHAPLSLDPIHKLGFDPNELILMYNGQFKAVKDLKIGDLIMEDDSTPRRVIPTQLCEDDMFKIIPIKGDSYIVNSQHILAIRCSYNAWIEKRHLRYDVQWMEDGITRSKTFSFSSYSSPEEAYQKAQEYVSLIPCKNAVFDVHLNEYLTKSAKLKHRYKGYRIGIEFPVQPVPMNPYILGYWLGDGTSNAASITTVEPEVIEYFTQNLPGLIVHPRMRNGEKTITYYIRTEGDYYKGSNYFLNHLRDINVFGNKHIPDLYKYNSRDVRVALLAGLIDSDGHYHSNCYYIVQKKKQLADDILYLCRSLGFACYQQSVENACTNSSRGRVTGLYYKCSISGSGLEEIPVLLPRKKAHPRQQIKDALNFGFTVEYLGKGPCCLVELNGNGRCILKDFTVTG
jgi:intein/homing endonuclease